MKTEEIKGWIVIGLVIIMIATFVSLLVFPSSRPAYFCNGDEDYYCEMESGSWAL